MRFTQLGLEHVAAPIDAAFDGADVAIHQARGVDIAFPHDQNDDHRLAVMQGQLLQGLCQFAALYVPFLRAGCADIAGGTFIGPRTLSAALLDVGIEAVAHDRTQPTAHVCPFPIGRAILDCSEQGFLHQILGFVAPSTKRSGKASQGGNMVQYIV